MLGCGEGLLWAVPYFLIDFLIIGCDFIYLWELWKILDSEVMVGFSGQISSCFSRSLWGVPIHLKSVFLKEYVLSILWGALLHYGGSLSLFLPAQCLGCSQY